MKTIFIMSLYGAAMILLTLLARRIFLKKSPKTVFKLLWLAAAARMVIPLFFRIPIYVKPTVGMNHAADRMSPKGGIIPIIYAAGMIFVSAFFAAAYIRGLKKYGGAKAVYSPELSRIANSFGLRRRVEFRIGESLCAPLTYGIFRPKIICPQNLLEYGKKQVEYAVYHELVHIKRFDAAYKLAVIAAVCIHWFNPLAWIMLRLSERDTELACDEEVLTRLGGREDYALALLAFEEKRRTAVFTAFGQNAVKERIELIMKFKKTTLAAIAAAAAAALCVTAVFALSPEIRTEDTAEPQAEIKAEAGVSGTMIVTSENGSEIVVSFSSETDGGESHSGILSHSDYAEETTAVRYNGAFAEVQDSDGESHVGIVGIEQHSDGILQHSESAEETTAYVVFRQNSDGDNNASDRMN